MPLSVPFVEYKESGEEHFDSENTFAVRVYGVNYADRVQAVKDLVGYQVPNPNITSGPGQMIRYAPDVHPVYDWLYCTSAAVKPEGKLGQDNQGLPVWTRARITATYHALEYSPDPTNQYGYLRQRFDFAGEFITTSNTTFSWQSDGTGIQEGVGILFPHVEYEQTWYQIDAFVIDSDAVSSLVGGVNNAPLAIGMLGEQPIGQVLYEGAEIHNTFAPDGSLVKQVTYKFRVRPVDFNKFLRPGQTFVAGTFGNWEYIQYKGAPPAPAGQAFPNGTPYPYVDLTKLWTPFLPF